MTESQRSDKSHQEASSSKRCLMQAIKLGILLGTAFLILIIVTAIAFLVSYYDKIRFPSNNTIVLPNDTDYGERAFTAFEPYDCGQVKVKNNVNRIVGGSKAVHGSWPWSVFIAFDVTVPKLKLENGLEVFNQNLSFTCGGTLINLATVLTAAHCASVEVEFTHNGSEVFTQIDENTLMNGLTVYLGVNNITDILLTGHSKHGIERKVTKISRHENYDFSSFMNDIALLHLSQPAILTDNIQVVCLPKNKSSTYPKQGAKVDAVGWGVLEEDDEFIPSELQNVQLTVYNFTYCNNLTDYATDSNRQLCVGELAGSKDTCQGDSGGSIFALDTFENVTKYISVGVVSYGVGCARVGAPGIYSRTSYYLDWILSNMKA